MEGYHFKIELDGEFYIASCIELEGCRTQGKSIRELRENMQEVLELFLNEPEGSKKRFNRPVRIEEVIPQARIAKKIKFKE